MQAGKKQIYWLGCFVAGAIVCGLVPASRAHPFEGIPAVNVFRLRQPVAADPVIIPRRPLPPVALTGLFDWFGKKLAFLEVTMPNQPKASLTLAPGQREGEIELLSMDAKAGTAEVKLFDTVTNLVVAKNGPQPAAPPTPPRAAATLPPTPPPAPLPAHSQLGTDETALVIEAERERLRQAGDAQANLMPVTHLTPPGAPGTEEGAAGSQGTEARPTLPLRKQGVQPR